MSEDTEKPLTAVEIEQKLKQERQLQIDQSSENKESTPEPKKVSLGIDKLKKSKKEPCCLFFFLSYQLVHCLYIISLRYCVRLLAVMKRKKCHKKRFQPVAVTS